MTGLYILAGLMLWIILGCGMLASIDDDEERLLKWAKSGPFGGIGVGFTILLWPVAMYFWYKA